MWSNSEKMYFANPLWLIQCSCGVMENIYYICQPNTHPSFTPHVWKRYYILNRNISRNHELVQSLVCPLVGWTNGWKRNARGATTSYMLVCFCGFGVKSSLRLLMSRFELSSTHCPAPRVLASLAVFKRRIKKSEKESRLCNFYTWRFVHMYS